VAWRQNAARKAVIAADSRGSDHVPANLPLCSGAGRHTHCARSFPAGVGKSASFQGREQPHGVSVQVAVQIGDPSPAQNVTSCTAIWNQAGTPTRASGPELCLTGEGRRAAIGDVAALLPGTGSMGIGRCEEPKPSGFERARRAPIRCRGRARKQVGGGAPRCNVRLLDLSVGL
jgi:hypothetical protein